jgi:hypothetical protein
MHSKANADAKDAQLGAFAPEGIGMQPNAMSGSKLGSNGLALSLSARMVMGHS